MSTPEAASPTYCSNNMTSPNCLTWSESGNSTNTSVVQSLYSFCNQSANIVSNVCRNFCSKTAGAWCDDPAQIYCAANPTDTGFCGCMNLSTDAAAVKAAVQAQGGVWDANCNYAPCMTSSAAYKSPAANSGQSCTSQTVCATPAVASEYPNLSFSCTSGNVGSAPYPTGATLSSPTNSLSASSSSASSGLDGVDIFAIILISLLVLAFIVILVRRKMVAAGGFKGMKFKGFKGFRKGK